MRPQFAHVIDVAPTVLEAAGLPEPVSVNGIQQQPLHGVSMAYAFADPGAAERHETQYFEMFGNRGIYHQGWTAVTKHKTPWILVGETVPAFDDDVWELYDTTTDWSQARDLAAEQPEKLHELQRLWLLEATRNGVLPLDDRVGGAAQPRPRRAADSDQGHLAAPLRGHGAPLRDSVVSIKNKSHAVTAEVVVPASGAEGVIIAQGGSIGGWSLYAKAGKPKYCYNLLGIQRFYVEGERALPEGTHQVRMEFAYDGGGLGKGGTVTLYLDGEQDRGGPRRRHGGDGLLRRRHLRRGRGGGRRGDGRLRHPRQRFQRGGQLGADRPRGGRRGRRPLDHPGGAPAGGHGPPVAGSREQEGGRGAHNGVSAPASSGSGSCPASGPHAAGSVAPAVRCNVPGTEGSGPQNPGTSRVALAVIDCPSGARSPVMR